MASYRHLKSVVRLNELVEEAVDLTKEGELTARRIETMQSQAVGLKLFFATERVSEITLSSLYDLAEETQALAKMQKMQAGEVINFIEGFESENRSVLH